MERKKSDFFAASVRCPKCGKAMKMRVSDITDYAYQCLDCDEDFYSFECPETVCDYQNGAEGFAPLYEITLYKQPVNWYKKHKHILDKLCAKFNVDYMACDDSSNKNPDKEAYIDEAFVDFGWKNAPNASIIQSFTDEIMKLI